MCVIICNPKGKRIPESTLRTCATQNPHGLGVVWLDTMEVEKVPSDDWWVLDGVDRPFVAHFRWATVGLVNETNIHPFPFGGDKLLMMNGTIPFFGNDKVCDTMDFADYINESDNWDADIASVPNVRSLVVNKATGKVKLYNAKEWYRDGAVWYSNNRHQRQWGNGYRRPMGGAKKIPVAVYGTLKHGHSNHHYIDDSMFVGDGSTVMRYPMVDMGIPFVMNEPGVGHHIVVETYLVDDKTLRALDRLEGHPIFYNRVLTSIEVNGVVGRYWMYFSTSPKPYDDGDLIDEYVR